MPQSEQQSNIGAALETTLKNSDLQSTIFDVAEIGIDSLLNDGLIKDIPVVGTIVGLMKTGANIQDVLFLKKIMGFLGSLKNIAPEKRREMIDKIDTSGKFRVKVGEKLLYIIDSCEDFEIAELVSRVFKYYIEGHITYEEFLKTASVLKGMNKVDFNWFIQDRNWNDNILSWDGISLDSASELMHTGLFQLQYEDLDVEVIKKPKNPLFPFGTDFNRHLIREESTPYNTKINSGGIKVYLTRPGEIIIKIFSPGTYIPEKPYRLGKGFRSFREFSF